MKWRQRELSCSRHHGKSSCWEQETVSGQGTWDYCRYLRLLQYNPSYCTTEHFANCNAVVHLILICAMCFLLPKTVLLELNSDFPIYKNKQKHWFSPFSLTLFSSSLLCWNCLTQASTWHHFGVNILLCCLDAFTVLFPSWVVVWKNVWKSTTKEIFNYYLFYIYVVSNYNIRKIY